DDYLAKPFERVELLARIENLITQRQRLRNRLRDKPAASSAPTPAPGSESGLAPRLHSAVEARLGDEEFGVDELAAAVNMERTGLYRHMVEEMGTTPSELIRDV